MNGGQQGPITNAVMLASSRHCAERPTSSTSSILLIWVKMRHLWPPALRRASSTASSCGGKVTVEGAGREARNAAPGLPPATAAKSR